MNFNDTVLYMNGIFQFKRTRMEIYLKKSEHRFTIKNK